MAATLTIPATVVPAVTVNFIFTGLAFLIVGLRLCTRTFMVKNLGVDDILIAFSMAAAVGFLSIFMLQIKFGLGREVTFPELPGFLQAVWATIPVYNLSLVLCKLSITVQCYRVLRTNLMQRFFKGYFVVLVVYGLWTFFSSIFTCWPIETYWLSVTGAKGTCLDKTGLTFSNAAINIATDIILIAVPMPLLWRLQIPRRQKYVLIALFCLGIFATVTSVIRLHALYLMGIAEAKEQSIKGISIAIWSCIEINTAIICASVPAVKPLVVKFFPKLLLSEMYKRTNYYANRSGNKVPTNGSTTDSGTRSRVAATASAVRSATPGPAMVTRPGEIKVHQSFELTSAPASAVINRLDLDASDDEKKGRTRAAARQASQPASRDGSEKNLFASSWQDDDLMYHHQGSAAGGGRRQKKPSITSHPREIV